MRSPAGSARLRRAAVLALPLAGMLAIPRLAAGQAEADGYLERMSTSREATYQARQLVVYLGRPQSAAVVEVRMTPKGRFVRVESADETTRVWLDPAHGIVSDDDATMEDHEPPVVPLDKDRILAKYDVVVETPRWVLDSTVVPLALVRREDRRLVERMWVHPETGVVYRRELYGRRDAVVGMMTTLDMRWGESADPEPYRGAAPGLVRVARSRGAPASLPFGYRMVSSSVLEARGRRMVHWLYSDGLHGLSVFRLPGAMRQPLDAYSRKVDLRGTSAWVGPGPGTWMWEGGDSTWAVVAEEPQLDPVRLTARFPKGERSVASRMGSWWTRGFRWVRDRL